MANAQRRARDALSHLLPRLSPWAAAVLFAPYRDAPDLPRLSERESDDLFALRLGPLLMRYLAEHEADVPAQLRAELPIYQAMGDLRMDALLAEAHSALGVLRAAGINFAVSKGPGIARHYPAVQLRPYSDIDILLSSEDFPQARRLLGAAGWHVDPGRREQREYFERRCREAVNLERGVLGRIDLHHHVPPWLWGASLPTEELISRAVPFTIAGYEFPVLDAVDNFLVSCLHIVSDRSEPGRSLIVWRDIVKLGRAVDVAEVERRAGAANLLGWIAAVVASLPAEVRPFPVPERWKSGRIRHPRRLLVMLNHGNEGSPIRRHLARLPAVPGGVLYAAGVTFPDREFLTAHVHGSMKLLRWITNARG